MSYSNVTEVWAEFSNITKIGRPSKKEGKIREYLINWAKEHGLESETDEAGNVIIRKKAAEGQSGRAPIALQAHMDMVCEKDKGVSHDWENDPIKTKVEGEWLTAEGTTLGADDGIGMAMALAILKSDTVRNSELECLFTVDEETGLYGATNIKEGWLKAKTLINLDSEEEGEFCIGCAGGRDTIGELKFETEEPSDSLYFFSVTVSGLVGGHSGEDINKNRGNSIKIIGEYLNRLNEQCGVRIARIKGGNLRNAIPRYAEAVVAVPFSQKETAIVAANIMGAELQKTYAGTDDKDVDIKIESHTEKERIMSKDVSDKLIKAIIDCPHGVIEMSKEIPGLVDTSTNLAAVSIKDSTIIIETSQRSPSESGKEKASKAVGKVLNEMGAKTTYGKDYPGWEPNFESDIVKKCCESYKKLYGKSPIVKVIHAGLECGVFLRKYPDLDMISFGPTLESVHSPSEKVNIPSTERTYGLLIDIIENA